MQKKIAMQLKHIYTVMIIKGIFSGYITSDSDNNITFSTSETFGSLFVNTEVLRDYIHIFGKDL
jgi:hypothetical protein